MIVIIKFFVFLYFWNILNFISSAGDKTQDLIHTTERFVNKPHPWA